MENINIEQYKATDILMHKAVQLITFLGKNLGKQQADDSHTTAVYDPKKNALVGKPITINRQQYTPELRLKNFNLALVLGDKSSVFGIKDRTLPIIVQEIKQLMKIDALPDFGLHYELPPTYQLAETPLKQPASDALIEWANVRQLAAETFEVVNTLISPPSPIYIWPHHFDTGTYHVLATGEEGSTASIGCGFAMEDTIVSEPYFYIYGWAKDQSINFDAAPDLPFGEWKKGEWKGAVLPLSAVITLPNLKGDLKSFFAMTSQFFKKEIV